MGRPEEIGEVIASVSRLGLDDFPWFAPREADGSFVGVLRALDGQSGAYLIREAEEGEGSGRDLLYVGMSKTGRLYSTATRHFQRWDPPHDRRSFWNVPVVMAAILCPPWAAEELQFYLIQKFRPLVNLVWGDGGIGEEVDAEVPF